MKKYSAEGIMEQRSEVLDIPTGPGEQQSSLQQKRKLCKHHQAGHCRRGDKCNFDHNAEMCDQYNPYSERTCANEKCVERHPGICPFYILKTCHFGFKCSLSHHADNTYDKVSQRLRILENKLSDPPPSNSLCKELAVRMSDFEERSKRLNMSINDIRKDLNEVSSDVQRTTIRGNDIKELEKENQFVHEKLVCLSEYIGENFESFSAADENILSKYSGIEEDINVLKEAMRGTVKVLELLKIINKPPSNDQMIV